MAQPRDCHSSQHTPAFAGLRGKASTVQIVLSALRHELGRSNRRAFSSPACPAPDFNPPLPGWALSYEQSRGRSYPKSWTNEPANTGRPSACLT